MRAEDTGELPRPKATAARTPSGRPVSSRRSALIEVRVVLECHHHLLRPAFEVVDRHGGDVYGSLAVGEQDAGGGVSRLTQVQDSRHHALAAGEPGAAAHAPA